MPYFKVEDLDLSPDEFLEKCSKNDLEETFQLLTTEYGFSEDDTISQEDIRSEGHRIFLKNLQALRQSWYSLNKEDAQIIDILGKKYGAV